MRLPRWVGLVVLIIGAGPALAADLSPAHWPTEERTRLEQDQFQYGPKCPGDVKDRSILVTGSVSPVAVHAGVEALRQGGTAA